MTFTTALLATWVGFLVAFVLGATWGRGAGRAAGLAAAASHLEDEACRAMLHGHDQVGGVLFRVAVEVRLLDGPPPDKFKGPAPAGTTASKADGARLDTSGAR